MKFIFIKKCLSLIFVFYGKAYYTGDLIIKHLYFKEDKFDIFYWVHNIALIFNLYFWLWNEAIKYLSKQKIEGFNFKKKRKLYRFNIIQTTRLTMRRKRTYSNISNQFYLENRYLLSYFIHITYKLITFLNTFRKYLQIDLWKKIKFS